MTRKICLIFLLLMTLVGGSGWAQDDCKGDIDCPDYIPQWQVRYEFTQLVMSPCPERPRVVDEFGRVYQEQAMTLEACMTTLVAPLVRHFDTEEAARRFVARAKKEPDLSKFQIIPPKEDSE